MRFLDELVEAENKSLWEVRFSDVKNSRSRVRFSGEINSRSKEKYLVRSEVFR